MGEYSGLNKGFDQIRKVCLRKLGYESREQAQQANPGQYHYKCVYCGRWHLAKWSRAEARQRKRRVLS